VINLLQETLDILKEYGKTPNDVVWVGSQDQYTTWKRFEEHANQSYCSGFGSEEVDPFLIICGNDWWLSRGEYDGSEWWEFNTLPSRPNNFVKLLPLFVRDQVNK